MEFKHEKYSAYDEKYKPPATILCASVPPR